MDQQLPSNQKFGAFFAFLFAISAIYACFKLPTIWLVLLLALSILTAITTILTPQFLSPFNQLWYRFGLLLSKIVSPLVLGIIFFLIITPVALITRAFGRDELLLKKRDVPSYWIERQSLEPMSNSFKNQF